ncbi:MAG: hypothetical protein AB7O24_30750 [Kofleriaceae bacterium]
MASVIARLAIALLLGLAGCYSRATVSASSLRSLTGGQGARIALDTIDGNRVVLTPRSHVQFRRIDGTLTPAVDASDISITSQGVALTSRDIPLVHATEVIVWDLEPLLVHILHRTAPPGVSIEVRSDRSIHIVAGHGVFDTWLKTFLIEAARDRFGIQTRCEPSCAYQAQATLERLSDNPAGAFGRWAFSNPHDGWRAIPHEQLPWAVRSGVAVPEELFWRDIHSADISNLSGARTLGAIAAGTALAGPATAAGLIGGSGFVLPAPPDLPTLDVTMGHGLRPGAMTQWYSGPAPSQLVQPQPLFTRWSQIRSIVDPAIAFEVGRDPFASGSEMLEGSAVLTVRLAGVLETGFVARYAVSDAGGFDVVAGLFRIGGHLNLDINERFAVPFGIELGATSEVETTFRSYLGLRVRLAEHWFLGAFPCNPVWTDLTTTVSARPRSWRFPSTLELGFAF